MSFYDAFILGILQGMMEFLPISSSGHLVLMERYLGLSLAPDVLLHFDIALHGGSFIALLLYFGKTWLAILRSPFKRQNDGGPPLLFLLVIGTVPVGIAGFFGIDWIIENTRGALFVAFGFIFTGAFLILSSWFESRFAAREGFGWKQVIGAGIGQAIAVFPGFSRSGITLASGRFMGLTARSATELSFLLGTPALAGALILSLAEGKDMLTIVGSLQVLIGFTASLFVSLAVIHLFLMTVRRFGVWLWAAYLFVAAVLILADEMLPLITALPHIMDKVDVPVVAGVIFIAMLLSSAPFTSFFVPSAATLAAATLFFRNEPMNIVAMIPIASVGMILGNLLGYIPARQARMVIRWSEDADERLTRIQHFFRKWGIATVIIGEFSAFLRPWIAIAAGIGNMRPLPYVLSMIVGSIALVCGIIGITAALEKVIF
ncbi:MAG TPA: undecaprenyl-diphosphate phosphatase [Candidatus Peribacterales bacterium]|nr:undecaprenyl-diphosphate phosphatase [Candidatus Peribacterales bacterium]